ncbi:hypothetical protein DFH07DRAFT_1032119 [Mycena maculata]|uniref:Uncharacterized protein n=1 Tax=Mycena maculata TaxID=230809 RepID=A0AAD7IZI5_9AGAR|nr:hypothetical protein DFH07DRAFT_1032119 [Mycena maculata]
MFSLLVLPVFFSSSFSHLLFHLPLPITHSLTCLFSSYSFKSKKNPSRERTASRSPPLGTTIPSCLRSPTSPPLFPAPPPSSTGKTTSNTLDNAFPPPSPPSPTSTSPPTSPADTAPLAPPTPLAALCTVYTSAATSATVSTPLTAASQMRTVPLRACCPECVLRTEVREECFSRGAERVFRRRAGHPGAQPSLFLAARAGGFLCAGDGDAEGDGEGSRLLSGTGGDAEGTRLLSGTGLAEVTRLVAELERRRASASPSPVGTPSGDGVGGRTSPSLLGPALARVVEGGRGSPAYGERLTADGSRQGSRQGSRHGSGRASPLLPLGIAVDEVDKERRRRSADLGTLSGGGVVVLDDEYEAALGYRDRAPRTPSPRSKPVPAYADDDDAELFPLPSRGSTPGTSPRGSPAGSPGGSAVSVARGGGSPKAGGLLAQATQARGGTPYSREGVQGGAGEKACVVLGAVGRREREERESEKERRATCARGLLLPPGDVRGNGNGHERGENGSGSSREGSVSSGEGSEAERRDVEKPLPVLPRLAASVLAAGPYSPAIAPRVYPPPISPTTAAGQGSHHARGASAPPGPSSRARSPPTAFPASASAPSASAPSTATPAPPPPAPLRRASSAARLRSPSTSSTGTGKGGGGGSAAGRKAFGALVDVLKGVTSMSGGPGGVAV